MNKFFDETIISNVATPIDFIASILQSSTEYSIIAKGLDGTILLWNEGARRIYGYEPEEVIGKVNATLLHTAEDIARGKPKEIMDLTLKTGKWEGILQRQRKNGEQFQARVVMTLLRNAAKKPIGFLLISKDISEEIRLAQLQADQAERLHFEKELQEKNVELERANDTKDRFLASMSHELRTPLNAIIGFTGTLLMKLPGPLNPEQEKQLNTVRISAKHLLSLINDLLDLAKVESGKIVLKLEKVDCISVINEVAATLKPAADIKKLELNLQLPPDEKLMILTDRRALTQILINLINNAIKFTNKGEVNIQLQKKIVKKKPHVVIQITDTGSGIKPEDQEKLFQAFVQIATDENKYVEGTGLGLYLSKKLSTLIHGNIEFESKLGKGSRFSLILPIE